MEDNLTDTSMIKLIQSEFTSLVAHMGPPPAASRPADEAYDIYAETRFPRDRRAHALAAVCYWCGIQPAEALESETAWS